MGTLKLTTLAMLMSFGLPLSDVATAYPEPVDQVNGTGDRGLRTHCLSKTPNPPQLKKHENRSNTRSESALTLTAPSNTSAQDQNRHKYVHICRLDLDLIETD